MGRPTKLTEELARSIIDTVLRGVPPLTAAKAHGIAEATWYEWLARGKGTDPDRSMVPAHPDSPPDIFAELADAIDAAVPAFEAAMVNKAVMRVRSTADALMLLERHPATRGQWRPPARTVEQATTITGPDGGPVRVEVARPEAEQELRDRLDSLIEFITAVEPEGDGAGEAQGQNGPNERGAATGGPRVP